MCDLGKVVFPILFFLPGDRLAALEDGECEADADGMGVWVLVLEGSSEERHDVAFLV